MDLLAKLQAKEKGSINIPTFISSDLFAILKTQFKQYNFRSLVNIYKGHLYDFCDVVANPEKFKLRELVSGDSAWEKDGIVILEAYVQMNDSVLFVIEPA